MADNVTVTNQSNSFVANLNNDIATRTTEVSGQHIQHVRPDSGDSTLGNGRKTVTTAGTAEQLSGSSVPCYWVIITAETDNTGIVVIGGSGVIAAQATRQGVPLYAGDSVTLFVPDLNTIYLDTTVSGDGVTFAYGA